MTDAPIVVERIGVHVKGREARLEREIRELRAENEKLHAALVRIQALIAEATTDDQYL